MIFFLVPLLQDSVPFLPRGRGLRRFLVPVRFGSQVSDLCVLYVSALLHFLQQAKGVRFPSQTHNQKHTIDEFAQ